MKYIPVFFMAYASVMIATPVFAQSEDTLSASFDLFEDRVELSWRLSVSSGSFVQIERNGEMLAVRARTETTFADATGDPGVRYQYCVAPVDGQGNKGAAACASGRRRIFPPANVAATDRTLEDLVRLTWTDRSEVEVGYRIYRNEIETPDSSLVATLAANRSAYDDADAETGILYRYCVVGFDAGGFATEAVCDEGTRGSVMPPAAVQATDGQYEDRVRITWIDQTSMETAYTVYRDDVQIGALPADATQFEDFEAELQVDHTYCVTSTIGAGESVPVCDTGRRGGLTPPEEVVASDLAFDDRVDVSWADASGTEDGFLITRLRNGVMDGRVGLVNVDVTSVADEAALQAVDYTYCVQSFSLAAAPDTTFSAQVCDAGARSAVLAPTTVAATDGTFEDKVDLVWTNPSTTVMLFNIYRDGEVIDNAPATASAFTDINIPSGTDHEYCVSAVTVTGASAAMAVEVAALLDQMSPGGGDAAPRPASSPKARLDAILQLAPLQGSGNGAASAGELAESGRVCDGGGRRLLAPSEVAATFEEFEDRVAITWTDNSAFERGHRIYRQSTDDTAPVLAGEVGGGRTSFNDFSGIPGTRYTYSVRAYDLRGPGGLSEADTDEGQRTLAPPTALQATDDGSETEVRLTWEDQSTAETGYAVFRDGAPLGMVEANIVSYTDTNPMFGTVHRYEVAALDSIGYSERASDNGGTVVLEPGSFNASDLYPDRVVLAWEDLSEVETQYRITRNGAPLDVLNAGAASYEDTSVVPGVTYTYCAVTWNETDNRITASQEVCDTGRARPEQIQENIQRLVIDDDNPSNLKFSPIAISGDIAVSVYAVGSSSRDTPDTLSVLIYERNPESLRWVQTDRLTSPEPEKSCLSFGYDVALSGTTLLVGMPDFCANGADSKVLVYDKPTGSGQWNLTQELTIDKESTGFGTSIAIHGNHMVAGAPNGASFQQNIFFFHRPSETSRWEQTTADAATGLPEALIGANVSITDKYAIVGGTCRDSRQRYGGALIYRRNAAQHWVKEAELTPFNFLESTRHCTFGSAVSITGNTAFVGHYADPGDTNGTVYVYQRDEGSGQWGKDHPNSGTGRRSETQRLRLPREDDDPSFMDNFGRTLAASGGLLLVGAERQNIVNSLAQGATFLFKKEIDTTSWTYIEAFDPGPEDTGVGSGFAKTLAISDGDIGFSALRQIPAYAGAAIYLSTFPVAQVIAPLAAIDATDGTFSGRVQVTWTDDIVGETGYRVYRDGAIIAELGADSETFSDFDVAPGRLAEYCVEALHPDQLRPDQVCDYGWLPSNGAISGRVRPPEADPTGNEITTAPFMQRDQLFGAAGTATAQSSVAGQDSVLICVTPDPNRGLLFDGLGGSVNVDAITLPASFTFEFWARRSEIDNKERTMLSIGRPESGQHIAMRFLDRGTFRFRLGDTDLDFEAGEDLDWHHWAVTHTQGVGARIYRDGIEVAVETGAIAAPFGGSLVFGAFLDVENTHFSGVLDEVRFWDHARSASQILEARDRDLGGTETGLLGYWPMNQGRSTGVSDLTREGRHGRMRQGVYWTERGARPSCALADTQGNYTLGNLAYDDGMTFTVTPDQDLRSFDPPASEITLRPENPVQNQVDFTDVTQFSISGLIQYEGTACPVPDVELQVGGLTRGTSQRDGSYSASLSPSRDATDRYLLKPVKSNPQDAGDQHFFQPVQHDILLDQPLFDVNFVDTKKRTLQGFFGGSCEVASNLGSATIKVTTDNGCFEREYVISESFSLDLPPQKYLVQVTDIETADDNLRADIIQYFDELGVQEIDLTTENDTLDLTYHAPVSIAISGFPVPPSSCTAYTTDRNETLPLVPLLTQDRTYDLTLRVSEDYGNGRACPVNQGTVTIYDAIADSAEVEQVYEVENGEVQHKTIAASANIFQGAFVEGVNRSFQKSLTAVAEVPGRAPLIETAWVLVEGARVRTAEFVSATTDPFPLLILHDPPGSNSSAYIEKGSKMCTTLSNMQMTGGAAGAEIDVVLGIKLGKGLGIFIEDGVGLALRTRTVAGRDNTVEESLEVCATTTERFSTPGDPTWVGEDLFMGVALNLLFARADEVAVNACQVDVTEKLAADLDPENAFETTYVYGSSHIQHSLIPDLKDLIELSGGDPTLTGDPNGDGNEETVRLTQALANWQNHLAGNDALKKQALDGTVKNRSFSAGADYEFSHSDETVRTTKETIRIYVNSENGVGAVLTGLGYDQTFLAVFDINHEIVSETTTTTEKTETIGYTLSDGDTGDFYSVDIGTDPRYGTPVFNTVSGRSSNPWESNTQRRDWPLLDINPPVQFDVPPDEGASFTLTLTNASESKERREYILHIVKQDNPGSAFISITGDPIDGDIYLVDGGESQEISLFVERGPNRYTYEDLAMVVYPTKEYEIWQADPRQSFVLSDTARFSVHYSAPCSPIDILRPKDLWSVNAASVDDSLEVILRGFDLGGSDIFNVERIGVEYRLAGDPDWFPARSIAVNQTGDVESDSLDVARRSWTTRWQPGRDGAYEVRAFTSCGGTNRVESDPITGIVDTKPPKPLGTPEPADEVLKLGGVIAATFNEPVACGSVVTSGETQNTTLTYLDGPNTGEILTGFTATCDGRTVVLDPPDEFDWTPLEGRLLLVSLEGIKDIAGNPVTEPVRWRFTVRRSAFAWQPANKIVEIPRGTSLNVEATLINGRSQPAAYQVPAVMDLLPENGSAPIPLDVSHAEGTVVAQGEQPVSFVIPDSLMPGRYTSTLIATRYEEGTAKEEVPFYFTADVVCRAPSWAVIPHNFEQSMTLTAQLLLEGEISSDTSDVLVAMVDGEVRGVGRISEAASGAYTVPMLIYGTAQNELVQFNVWDDDACTLHRQTSKAFIFKSGQMLGSPGSPIVIEAPIQAGSEVLSLAAGWTWFSTNRVLDDPSINTVLGDVLAAPGDLIKGQTAYAQYDAAAGWVGPLQEIENGTGYFARLQQSNSLVQDGTPMDPTTPIVLNRGWSWIGYMPTSPVAIDEALASLTPADGDLIKSQFGFAQYVEDAGWIGSLTHLEPGLGYLMYAAEGGTLVYPSQGSASTVTPVVSAMAYRQSPEKLSLKNEPADTTAMAASDSSLVESTVWTLDAGDFSSSMTIIAELWRDEVPIVDPDLQVGVFDGDVLRGLGRIRYVDAVEQHRAFVVVYGDEEASRQLEIRLLYPSTGDIEVMDQRIAYEANARMGLIGDPVLFTRLTEEIPTEFLLEQNYPNPFNPETTIRFALPQESPVQLDVFDVIGRRIARLVNEEKLRAGWHTVAFDGAKMASGTYLYRIKAGDFKSVHKMVLVK